MAVLSSTARAAIIKETKAKYGPSLPEELLSVYIDAYVESDNDSIEAGNVMRQSTTYKQLFPGNLNPDGVSVKYSEGEYLQIVDAFKRKVESVGINADLIITNERIETLIENVISPKEFGERVQGIYQNVLSALPQVKEFYQLNFGRELSDVEIIASAIDPNLSQQLSTGAIDASAIVSQNILRSQIGGAALAEGFNVTLAEAEELRKQGLTAEQARKGFRQAGDVIGIAERQGRATTAAEVVSGLTGDPEEMKRIQRILAQQQSLSAAQLGSATTQTGQVIGLMER